MKRITLQTLARWLAKGGNGRSNKMAPFPCAIDKGYPTRIAVRIEYLNGKPFTYIGKPSGRALDRCVAALRNHSGYDFIEFDREGVVGTAHGHPGDPNDREGFGIINNDPICAVYHPWQRHRSFFDRFRAKVYRHPGSKLCHYIPLDAVGAGGIILGEYLRYLEGFRMELV